jgi:CheY-like chemotaxis protein
MLSIDAYNFWLYLRYRKSHYARKEKSERKSARAPAPLWHADCFGPAMATFEARAMAAKRVLVVDDDPSILEIVTRVLAGAGMQVTTARRVAVARAILLREQFDLILTDARMPGETGLEFAETTRALGIATVVMSGEPEWNTAHGMTAQNYLAKPFDVAGLLAAVAAPDVGHETDSDVEAELVLGGRRPDGGQNRP